MARVFRFTPEGAEPSTHEEAERIAGFKLDRRLNYAITGDGEVEEEGVCTLRCSGCSCGCEGGCSCGDVGFGCRECGYTGKRRHYFGLPARTPEQRKDDREYFR
ncbi:hypothetical protein D9M68_138730 [compost metagenome]